MLRTTALGIALAVLAQTAAAEEKVVFITEHGFFPEIVYADDGDTVTFVNEGDISHKLHNEEVEWETDTIAVGQSKSVTVWQGMKNRYYSDQEGHDSAVITFGAAPS
ncbi:MAG: cupredoxin domain-containing protein [Paracoccaceae bacterium]